MDWPQIIGSVAGSGPLAGALAFALWKVWNRVGEVEARAFAREKELEARCAARETELEKQVHDAQLARIEDLKWIAKQDS